MTTLIFFQEQTSVLRAMTVMWMPPVWTSPRGTPVSADQASRGMDTSVKVMWAWWGCWCMEWVMGALQLARCEMRSEWSLKIEELIPKMLYHDSVEILK